MLPKRINIYCFIGMDFVCAGCVHFMENVVKLSFYCFVYTVFAFGRSYGVLFVARAVQGIGSSCSSVSGRYPLDVSVLLLFPSMSSMSG
jgi:hypothetical protein